MALYSLIIALSFEENKRPKLYPCHAFSKTSRNHFSSDETGKTLALFTLVAFALKAEDNRLDGEKMKAALMRLFFGKQMDRASKQISQIYQLFKNTNEKIDRLQAEGASAQTVIDAYGEGVGDCFSSLFRLSELQLETIKAFSCYNFLVDMLADYDDDFKHRKPNSFRQEDSEDLDVLYSKHYFDIFPVIQHCEESLLQSAGLLVKDGRLESLVFHKIIYDGVQRIIPGILQRKDVGFHFIKRRDEGD